MIFKNYKTSHLAGVNLPFGDASEQEAHLKSTFVWSEKEEQN